MTATTRAKSTKVVNPAVQLKKQKRKTKPDTPEKKTKRRRITPESARADTKAHYKVMLAKEAQRYENRISDLHQETKALRTNVRELQTVIRAKDREIDAQAKKIQREEQRRAQKAAQKAARKPRGPSAFFLFVHHIRSTLKSENPEATVRDIAKLAGAQWNELDDNSKGEWKERAAEQKAISVAEWEATNGVSA